jgi:thiamine biosynthesis protein ThiI
MLLLKFSEPLLKGAATRKRMEAVLVGSVKHALDDALLSMRKEGGVLLVEAKREAAAAKKLRRVFGINSILACVETNADVGEIADACVASAKRLRGSFAIRVHRVGEHSFTSTDVAVAAGRAVQEAHALRVDLDTPDDEIFVDIRGGKAFVGNAILPGFGGLPLGSQGRMAAAIESSAAIAAAWLMMKRGVRIVPVAPKRLAEQAKVLEKWGSGRIVMCDGDALCEAVVLALNRHLPGVVVGDALGVSVKRIAELRGAEVPLYRPLIAFEKSEINELLRTIKNSA